MTRTLRIVTGIILFVFVATHLLNMAFGLISLEAVESARLYFSLPWTNPVGFLLLAGSMLVHGALGLVAIYWRNTLQMSRYDLLQTISALLIVPLLASHVLGVTLAANMFSMVPSYESVLTFFWVQAPHEGLRQALVVAVTWIHGCAGLFTWMRLKPWWNRAAIVAYPLAVLIPVSALLGFVEAGNEVIAMSAAGAAANVQSAPPSAEVIAKFQLYNTILWSVIGGYLALVVITLLARLVRLRSSRPGIVTLSYLTGDTIRTEGGISLLEAAEANDLPHANICKGRGRCATCRVRIISSSEELPAPSELETKTLERFECPENVRLACQLVPLSGTIELERVLPPDVGLDAVRPPSSTRTNPSDSDSDLPAEAAAT